MNAKSKRLKLVLSMLAVTSLATSITYLKGISLPFNLPQQILSAIVLLLDVVTVALLLWYLYNLHKLHKESPLSILEIIDQVEAIRNSLKRVTEKSKKDVLRDRLEIIVHRLEEVQKQLIGAKQTLLEQLGVPSHWASQACWSSKEFSFTKLLLSSLPFFLVGYILFRSLYKVWYGESITEAIARVGLPSFLLLFLGALVVTAVVHEGFHGIAILLAGGQPKFGFARFIFYATGNWVISGRRFMIIALAPLVGITLLGLTVLLASHALALFAYYVLFFNTGGAAGDLIMVWRLLQLDPNRVRVLDTVWKTAIYAPPEGADSVEGRQE